MSEVWSLPGYELQTMIGFGVSGEVWRGRELATGEPVALKRLGEDTDLGSLEALRRVALQLRDLDTPYVVRLRDVVGRVLVLDHAPGGSLASLLARRGRLTAGEIVTVAAPLASALASAHALGVVHGDVSPASVLFTADGMPLLADLGVARVIARLATVDRTAEYADPAVAAGREPDAAADVWALAAVCHHLLAGTPPHDGAASPDDAVLEAGGPGRRGSLGPSASLGLLAPTAPRALVAAVEAVLVAEPTRRPDAAEFAALLRRAHVAAPVRLTGGPGPAEPVGETPVVRVSSLELGPEPEPESWRRRGPALGQGPRPGRTRARARPRRTGRAREMGRARASGQVCRRAALVAGLTTLVVSAAVLGWLSGRGDVPVAAALTPLPVPPAPTAPGPTEPAPTAPGPTGVASTAAAPDWALILDGLDAARAAAFATADQRALSAVWAPGSPGLAADTAAVQDLAADGHTAHGLRHSVQAIEVLAFDDMATTGGVARLKVADVLAEHEIRDAAGSVVRRGAARGETEWLVELVQTPSGWRLVSVAAA
ncbi:MAG: protein kinase domain-containing protein [Mycobacteriales bacterium]